jgi:hypothetical protein
MTVVASAATWGDWVNPMNNKAMTTVEGKPPISPPTLLPNLSALTVVRVTQRLPTIKPRRSLSQNEVSIDIMIFGSTPKTGNQHGGMLAILGIGITKLLQQLSFFEIRTNNDIHRQADIEG